MSADDGAEPRQVGLHGRVELGEAVQPQPDGYAGVAILSEDLGEVSVAGSEIRSTGRGECFAGLVGVLEDLGVYLAAIGE